MKPEHRENLSNLVGAVHAAQIMGRRLLPEIGTISNAELAWRMENDLNTPDCGSEIFYSPQELQREAIRRLRLDGAAKVRG